MSRIFDWLQSRTGYRGARHTMLDETLPPGTGWFFTLGSVLLGLLGVQLLTGAFLTLYYAPTPDHAYDSIRFIVSTMPGRLVRGLHHYGSSFIVVALVLHMVRDQPSYGNQLMDRIGQVTAGVLSVNPNTMYPLLRQLESRGLIEGKWEHPERRSRRYYSITDEGREEYERLVGEVRPFLDSIARSIDEIVREVYGEAAGT